MSVDFNFDQGNYGIVFYGSSDNYAATYVDILGQTRNIQQLSSGVATVMDPAIPSAYFHVGSASRFDFQVEIKFTGTASADLGLIGKFAEANTLTGLDDYTQLVTFLNATKTPNAVHTFSSSGKYMLQTANLAGMPTGAIRVTPTIAVESSVNIVVRLRVLT